MILRNKLIYSNVYLDMIITNTYDDYKNYDKIIKII